MFLLPFYFFLVKKIKNKRNFVTYIRQLCYILYAAEDDSSLLNVAQARQEFEHPCIRPSS